MGRHAVIMAGGAGTRLWPLSRRDRPKQLMRLFEGKSLLRQAYERLHATFAAEQILVVTADQHLPLVSAELPELPAENLVGEPAVRDTANAICLAAVLLEQRDAGGVMGVFTADHIIRPVARFAEAVGRAIVAADANPEALVTLGVRPGNAATGYGYVRRGREIEAGVFEVAEFREKPDREMAERYVADGNYDWNSGMFVWTVKAILGELERHLPASVAALRPVAKAWGGAECKRLLVAAYPGLQKISIDYAVMEQARRVLAVPLDCDWLDVGSWAALAAVVPSDVHGNTTVARRAVLVDTEDTLVVAEDDHLLATMGVKDLVVVHSADATLICRRADAERLKEMVERLKNEFGEKYA